MGLEPGIGSRSLPELSIIVLFRLFCGLFSLAIIHFFDQCGTPTKSTPFRGPAPLFAHRLVSTPLWNNLLTRPSILTKQPLLSHQIHSFIPLIKVELPPNPPISRPSVLGTPPRVYPLRGTTSSLAHRLVSGFDIICNGPSNPLANVVLFGLFFLTSKTCLLKRVSTSEWDLTH